jgi:hypothetical protein
LPQPVKAKANASVSNDLFSIRRSLFFEFDPA